MSNEQKIKWLEVPPELSGKLLAETLLDFVNSSTKLSNQDAIEGILGSHRTLQQYLFDFMSDFIWQLSMSERLDKRNEYAVMKARQIMNFLNGRTCQSIQEEIASNLQGAISEKHLVKLKMIVAEHFKFRNTEVIDWKPPKDF